MTGRPTDNCGGINGCRLNKENHARQKRDEESDSLATHWIELKRKLAVFRSWRFPRYVDFQEVTPFLSSSITTLKPLGPPGLRPLPAHPAYERKRIRLNHSNLTLTRAVTSRSKNVSGNAESAEGHRDENLLNQPVTIQPPLPMDRQACHLS